MSLRRGLAAALLLFLAGPLVAGTTEVPRLDAPVGSGSANSSAVSGAAVLAPPLSAPAALAAPAAPVLAPALAVAAPVAAVPIAAAAVPAAAGVPVASAPGAPRATFGKRVVAPGASIAPAAAPAAAEEAASDGAGDGNAWARSSELFDLSSLRGADAAAVPADLPSNSAGRAIARLRAANAPGAPGSIPGIERASWEGRAGGYSSETNKLRIAGKTWFLKRLAQSPDPVISATPTEERARNEAGMAAILREDPQLKGSFQVSAEVRVFRDGRDVFVLSEGLPSVGDGESGRRELSPAQRADASIIQLVLGVGDLHGADVLPLGGGRFGLIDFEKLGRAPMGTASLRQIDEEVLLKNYPLVDRLSSNDPAVYRARFESWKNAYRNGGRARMDHLLAEAGWPRDRRAEYLSAVDRNLETYLERLQPYLDYANAAAEKAKAIQAKMAADQRRQSEKKGFLSGLFGSGR